jgi:DNA-binding MarR family transcriptional regulator
MGNNISEDKDYNLWVLLHQARDAIYSAREKELDQYDISTRQACVLFVINAIGGKAKIAEISRWILREPHSVSGILNRMEKKGLVRKAEESGKKNRISFTITAKGKKAFSESLKRESIREIMSCLSEEEHQQLTSSMKKLRDKALTKSITIGKLPFP